VGTSSELFSVSTPNIVLRWYIDSIVALSDGGYVDPRWTTTLTAFDSKDEATEFVAFRLSSLFITHTAALHVAAKDLRTTTPDLICS